jgi:hypothetical protein
MNSFRLANGMSADFTFADKTLSHQVNTLYGPQLVTVAKYFLGSRYLTQVGLVCDVVSLAQSLGSGRPIQSSQEPVRVAFTPLPSHQPLEDLNRPPALSLEALPKASPDPITSKIPPKMESIPVASSGVRDDGVGNLDSSDKEALTEFDTVVVPKGKPKGKRAHGIDFNSRSRDSRSILTPSIWRIEFQSVWLNRGTNGNS